MVNWKKNNRKEEGRGQINRLWPAPSQSRAAIGLSRDTIQWPPRATSTVHRIGFFVLTSLNKFIPRHLSQWLHEIPPALLSPPWDPWRLQITNP
jgi:hypothetical protein